MASITIHESVDPAHTGTKIWDSGIVLSNYLQSNLSSLMFKRPRRIIELGSGTGIVGLTLASVLDMDIHKITLTDVERMVPVLQSNARANDLFSKVTIKPLDWNHSDVIDDVSDVYDFIIAADVVYAYEACLPLANTISKLVKVATLSDLVTKVSIMIAHEDRDPLVKLHFIDLMKERGFKCKRVRLTGSSQQHEFVHLYQFSL